MKTLAFYLPQFHEIPENNEWWGNGFTEWSNTKKATPLYPKHYQPRKPLDENYYDLSSPSVMVQQMNLAKKYGIDGFCFYHYWFNGKKLLEKPIEMILTNQEARLPFCLAWANEPWTRTWDGIQGEKQILMAQSYGGEESWKDHFQYLLQFFLDKRYLKIEGQPVFLIYRAQNIPNCSKMMELWRSLAKESGLPGIYFIQMITSFGYDKYNKAFDANVDFEPMRTVYDQEKTKETPRWKKQMNFYQKYCKTPILSRFLLNFIDYDSIYETIIHRKPKGNKKTYYGVFSDWDNSPRKKRKALIIHGASPKKFEKYLDIQIKRSLKDKNELLFINAWNEWGEGAYIEPDQRYGFAYLHAVRRALQKNHFYKNS